MDLSTKLLIVGYKKAVIPEFCNSPGVETPNAKGGIQSGEQGNTLRVGGSIGIPIHLQTLLVERQHIIKMSYSGNPQTVGHISLRKIQSRPYCGVVNCASNYLAINTHGIVNPI